MYKTFLTVLVPSIAAFAITVVTIRFLMGYMSECGVTATDYNKKKKPILPSGMGLATAFGFGIGLLTYVFGSSFNFYLPVASITYLFATVLGVLLVSLIGFLDDMNVKAKPAKTTGMMDTRVGLKQWQKPLLTLMGAIPLIAINAGVSIIRVPFLGPVNFGIFYPLIILPLAVIFAANSFNLLGGFNGISTGVGAIASLGLLLYSLFFGTYTGLLLSSVVFAVMLAIFVFDFYPSRILPGDSFTYFGGTALVAAMVVGNMESFGIVVFLPFIIEFFLHLRKKFDVTDLGKRQDDGTFKPPYGKKIYSWTHLIMNIKKCKEWEVSVYMFAIEALFVLLAFALKFASLL